MTIDISKGSPLGDDRILSLDDVCEITGFCRETATKLIEETGYGLKLC